MKASKHLANSKSVTFNEVPIIFLIEDKNNQEFEYRKQQPWYFMAVDRLRFKARVSSFNDSFGYIFTPSHRNTISDYIKKNII
jgi:hypothetical protein